MSADDNPYMDVFGSAPSLSAEEQQAQQEAQLQRDLSDVQAWLDTQTDLGGVQAFIVRPGMQLYAPGGGPLGPDKLFYNFGNGIGVFLPGRAVGDLRFTPQPHHDGNGFFVNTLSPGGIAETTREAHGGAAVLLAPFGVLAGVAAAGGIAAGAGETVAAGATADSAVLGTATAATAETGATTATLATTADSAVLGSTASAATVSAEAATVAGAESATESTVLGKLGELAANKVAGLGVAALVAKFLGSPAPKPSSASRPAATHSQVAPAGGAAPAAAGDWLKVAALVGTVLLIAGSN